MNSKTSIKNIIKFLIGSTVGFVLVGIPFQLGDKTDTISFYTFKSLQAFLGNSWTALIVLLMVISAVFSLIAYVCKPQWISKSTILKAIFTDTPFYIVNRFVGATIAVLVYFQVGPEFIISIDTGGTMLGLAVQLSMIIPPILFLQVFILESGAMEFLGKLLGFIVSPLFKLPGIAATNIISAWIGPGNAAIIGTRQLYNEGYFTQKDAAIIGSVFAVSSLGWAVLVASVLNLMPVFGVFYATLCIVGLIVAIISVRIYPITSIPSTYVDDTTVCKHTINNSDKNVFSAAVDAACERADKLGVNNFKNKIPSILSYVIALQPIVICWGTIALILSTYTPILQWVSYPIGMILDWANIDQAYQAGAAIFSGFADNYLPVILAKGFESTQTRFIVGVISILQLIFLSENGVLLITTKIMPKFKDIVSVFLIRTFISLPFVILSAKLFIKI